MDEGDLSAHAPQESNWEIYKDVFAPQPPVQRAKPWEKSSVRAHAPRIQGQKIWKRARKPGVKSQSTPESNAAQLELEMEGMGARKKQRVIGEKENISDAPWLADTFSNDKNVEVMNGNVSPRKKNTQSFGFDDADALLVPRKRTNGNHLITPRKSSRKSPLQTLELNLNSATYRSPAVVNSRIANTSTEQLAMNESAEKPRRRKSVRKSSRRRTLLEMAREAVSTFSDDLPESRQLFAASTQTTEEAVGTQTDWNSTVFQGADFTLIKTKTQVTDSEPEPLKPDMLSTQSTQDVQKDVDQVNMVSETVEAEVKKQHHKRPSRSSKRIHVSEELTAEVPSPIQAAAVSTTPQKSITHVEGSLVPSLIPKAGVLPFVATPDEITTRIILSEEDLPSNMTGMSIEQISVDELNEEVVILQHTSDFENAPVENALSSEHLPSHEDMVKAVEELPSSPAKKALLTLVAQSESETCDASLEVSGSNREGEVFVEASGKALLPDSPFFKNQLVSKEQTADGLSTPTESNIPEITAITKAIVVQFPSPSKKMINTKRRGPETPKAEGRTPQTRATRRSTRTQGSLAPLEEAFIAQDSTSASHSTASHREVNPVSTGNKVDFAIAKHIAGITDSPATTPKVKGECSKAVAQIGCAEISACVQHSDTIHNATLLNTMIIEREEDQQPMPTTTRQTEREAVSETLIPKSLEDADFRSPLGGECRAGKEMVTEDADDADAKQVSRDTDDTATPREVFVPRSISVSSDYAHQVLEPILAVILTPSPTLEDETPDDLLSSTTADSTSFTLAEQFAEIGPNTSADHDDTNMLLDFLTRVKANKAAKAQSVLPKRKRSLPHSPLQIPLGSASDNYVPSSPQEKDEFDVSLPAPLSKRSKRELSPDHLEEDMTLSQSIRRSGRTRLPKKATVAAPSFIPVRRLGQDGDSTVTLRRNEDKELVALTKVNTRKNKGAAVLPAALIARQAEDKENPASRQRALKEAFDEKNSKQKGKKAKSVVWAAELARYQSTDGVEKAVAFEKEVEKEKVSVEEKKAAVTGGMRSKMGLGMAANGTPAPKRKMRGRS